MKKSEITMKEVKESVKKQGLRIAWTYGFDNKYPYRTKKAAAQCRKQNFGELYKNAALETFLPIYQAVFCGYKMECTLDEYVAKMSENNEEKINANKKNER